MQWATDLVGEYLVGLAVAATAAVVVSWVEFRRTGARVRPAWLVGWVTFAFFLYFVVEREGWALLPRYLGLIDLALLGAALVVTWRHVERRIEMRPALGGWWFYRLGFTVPAVWLGLFAARLAIGVAVLGRFAVFGSIPPADLGSMAAWLALAATDALFAASTGVVAGQYLGIFAELRRRQFSAPRPAAPSP